MKLSQHEFDFICKVVRTKSAIELEASKEYLIVSRLEPLAKSEGFATISDMITEIKLKPYSPVVAKMVEAMTTNETSFFRDFNPFEALKKFVLPDLIKKQGTTRQMNVWFGACSSGQEPYSFAILLKETFPDVFNWNLRFICSDISQAMIKRTQEGLYNQLEVNRGMPAPFIVKYFQQKGTDWQVREDLRRIMKCQLINLAEPWPALPQMDLVFMRNVMIYFDISVKKAILKKIQKLLKPEGHLILGGAETTINLDEAYEPAIFGPSRFYRLKQENQNSIRKAA